ncbi:DUF6221 family protein [Streptomyces sp. NPDC102406]|uniref:DUF6221 family protein n=1 Tax=Streptomyces sp. NPDC102406 TaxID=3366171 RepID=UPI0038116356
MDELVRWLGEQYDEDARRLHAAADEAGGEVWQYDGRYVRALPEGDMVAVGSQDLMEAGIGEHVAEWDPARVLREVDAKRQTLALHSVSGGHECSTRDARGDIDHCTWIMEAEACTTVRLLALPYADRPGYKETWRP